MNTLTDVANLRRQKADSIEYRFCHCCLGEKDRAHICTDCLPHYKSYGFHGDEDGYMCKEMLDECE